MPMHAWLLRPLPHGSNQMRYFLENNRIAVGYPVRRSLHLMSRSELRKILTSFDWESGAGNVDRLVNLMKEGDIVVVPDDNGRDVYFAEVVSGYVYEETLDENKIGSGFPHQREVAWLFDKQPVPRHELPEPLLESLRYPGAVAELTKHLSIILEFIGIDHEDVTMVIDHDQRSVILKKANEKLLEALDCKDPHVVLKAIEIAFQNLK